MRRLVGLAAIGLAAFVWAQAGGGRAAARAGLHVETSEGHLDVASVVIDMTLGSNPSGELSFAGEGHSHGDGGVLHGPSVYPHIVVTLHTIESATVQGGKLTVRGEGVYNDTPVRIEAVAKDGGPNGRGDKFSLVCSSPGGVTLYTVDGKVTSGDISIQGGQR